MRRLVPWVLALCIAVVPRASAQALPDLGDTGALSPQLERRIGEEAMREVRAHPAYVDDAEVSDYLNTLGSQIVAAVPAGGADFEYFALRDPAVNAFALPGGFIGVHTGLILATETESELASVLAHETAHVTQRHISRMVQTEERQQVPVLLAVAAAILLSRSRPDLAVGAFTAAQAGSLQSQLSYSRDFEREADRVGFQALADAGFDTRSMPVFFEKLQRATRATDDGTLPTYLRTHPVTTERIADAQNRAANQPYRQRVSSIEYYLVRARLRAEAGRPEEALEQARTALRDGRYANEAAARYGLVAALLRADRAAQATSELTALRRLGISSPMIDTLEARARRMRGDAAGAVQVLREALQRFPHRKPLLYAYIELLHAAGRYDEARELIAAELGTYRRDLRLHGLYARTWAALGRRSLEHQAQAEVYALEGRLAAAIEQLQLARKAGDADFYQLSVVDARLKDLRARHALETPAAPGR